MIKVYNLPKDKNVKLFPNLYVKDLPCRKDKIIVDGGILSMLNEVRKHFKKKPVILRLNDPRYEYHSKGLAVDFTIHRISIYKIAKFLDDLHPNTMGIRVCAKNGSTGYIHYDLRKNKWRALSIYGEPHVTLEEMFPTLELGSNGQIVTVLKMCLNKLGYYERDKFYYGKATERHVVTFQKDNGIDITGVCDDETWNKILELI